MSQSRPNPIGLHRSRIVARGADWVELAAIEVVTGTRVLDVRPVITSEGDGR